MPQLVILTGPIAAGKNSVAAALVHRLVSRGSTVAVVDVDDVAAMVKGPGAAQAGLWNAAHEAHGALVGQWTRSSLEIVVVVGPIYSSAEQSMLTRWLSSEARVFWVVIDAPVAVTFERAQIDPGRGLSREHDFHHKAHRRFRELLPLIPADLTFDSVKNTAVEIASAVDDALRGSER